MNEVSWPAAFTQNIITANDTEFAPSFRPFSLFSPTSNKNKANLGKEKERIKLSGEFELGIVQIRFIKEMRLNDCPQL